MSRVEYDAYRTDVEMLAQAPRTDANAVRIEEAQQNFQQHKEHFEKLKSDVTIKIKFLDENRVRFICFISISANMTFLNVSFFFQIKVMHKQLLLFHNAISAYFSGNQQALEATLKQFNIKMKSPNSNIPSWLEQ